MNKSTVISMVFGAALILATAFSSQAQSNEIADGKKVKFDYTLRIEGETVETSQGKTPLEYVQGQGMIIPGLENSMKGMKVGEEKTVTIPAKDAYGEISQDLFREVNKTVFPEGSEFQVGAMIQMEGPEGQILPGFIWEVKDNAVIINFNHPLAGRDLEFEVKVVSVE